MTMKWFYSCSFKGNRRSLLCLCWTETTTSKASTEHCVVSRVVNTTIEARHAAVVCVVRIWLSWKQNQHAVLWNKWFHNLRPSAAVMSERHKFRLVRFHQLLMSDPSTSHPLVPVVTCSTHRLRLSALDSSSRLCPYRGSWPLGGRPPTSKFLVAAGDTDVQLQHNDVFTVQHSELFRINCINGLH